MSPSSPAVFPQIAPSGRTHTPAQYPIKTFLSEAGVEVRILYGSQPTGAKLSLQYNNLSDTDAELFVEHFRAVKGSFETFALGAAAKAGWAGDPNNLSKDSGDSTDNQWRYAQAPQLQSVKRGVSSVTVDLVAVL